MRINAFGILILLLCAVPLLSTGTARAVAAAETRRKAQHRTREKTEVASIVKSVDRIRHGDYTIQRTIDKVKDISSVYVRKNGRLLAAHHEGVVLWDKDDSRGRGSTQFGLFPALGMKDKQLFIYQFSSGLHCCCTYLVYDLYPDFRLVFNSEDYPVSDSTGESSVVDIDGDGVFELVFSSNWFAYFGGLPFVSSPLPQIVFRYNKEARKYYPANPRYSTYVLKTIEDDIKHIKDYPGYLAPVLSVMLEYIYAGKENLAWAIYERYYTNSDKESMRQEIKQRLKSDRIYQFIYDRYRSRA